MPCWKVFIRPCIIAIVATFILSIIAVDASVVREGLISYWTLDKDTIKKEAKDILEKNNARVVGNPKVVAGKIKEALYFTLNDYLEVQSNDELNLVKNFTIDTWVKGDNKPDNSGAKISQWFSKGDNYQLNWDHDNDTYQSVATRMTGGWLIVAQIQEPLQAQEWYHIAGTWNGRSLKIYLNGNLSKVRNWSGSSEINNSPLIIGGPSFTGTIDEVKLYNRALNDEEIAINFRDTNQQMAVTRESKYTLLWGKLKVQ